MIATRGPAIEGFRHRGSVDPVVVAAAKMRYSEGRGSPS